MKWTTSLMARQAIVAALYAVLTWALPMLAYGPIQFRLSEVMTLLAFISPEYIIGLTIGCAISNIFSSYGLLDVVIGSFASFLAAYTMSRMKNIWIASLMPALFSILIGIEIYLYTGVWETFYLVTLQIMASEVGVVTIIGVPLYKLLEKKGAIPYLDPARGNH